MRLVKRATGYKLTIKNELFEVLAVIERVEWEAIDVEYRDLHKGIWCFRYNIRCDNPPSASASLGPGPAVA